jgi:hypothetical protein
MPRIPEYTQNIIRQRAVPNTVNFQAIEDAGATMRGVAKITDAGAQLAIKIKEANDVTAVNDAVIAKQESDLEWLEEIKKQRQDNPFGFAKDIKPEFKKRDEEIIKNLPSSAAKRAFRDTSARLNLQNYQSAFNWENTRSTQIFASRIQNSIENNNLLMLRAGKEGKDPEQYLKNVDAATVAAGGVFAADKLADINQAGRGEGLKYYLQGMVDTNPQKVKEILDSKKYDDALGAEGVMSMYNKADAEIERQQAKYKAEISEDINAVEKAAAMGLTTPDDVLQSLAQKADTFEMDGVGDNLRKYASIQNTANTFAKMSVKDQAAQLKSLETEVESGNLDKVDEYSALANVYQNKLKMIDSDPWGYYSAHDIIHSPEPVNFQDPAQVKTSFESRRADVARVRELEGMTMPLLSNQEIAQIKTSFEKDGPESTANILASLGQGMNFDERRALSQQFAKDDAGIIAAALNQPQDVAEGILFGAKAKGEVSQDKVRVSVNSKIAGMVFDPEANESMQSAVYAYYKKLSLDAGDLSKEPDEDRIQKAIEDVVGKPAEISVNGSPSKVFLFRDDGKFIKENELEDVLSGFDDQIIKKANGSIPMTSDGQIVGSEDIKSKATFTTAGDGQYVAVYPGLGYIMDDKGQPYIFDIRNMKKAYKERGIVPKSKTKREGYPLRK